MAVREIKLNLIVKKRWFFWPLYYSGITASLIGFDDKKICNYIARKGFKISVK